MSKPERMGKCPECGFEGPHDEARPPAFVFCGNHECCWEFTVLVEHGASRADLTAASELLESHLLACADQYVYDVNGYGEWSVPLAPGEPSSEHELFVADPSVRSGSVRLVRARDGARFLASVSVAVWPERESDV